MKKHQVFVIILKMWKCHDLSTSYPSMYSFSEKHSLDLEQHNRLLYSNPYFLIAVRKTHFFPDRFYSR